jgi:outer membrane protein assembly factor BamD (BamD/ComL family)
VPRATRGEPRRQASESKLALENRALSGAIIRLRRQGDAAGALEQLDDYLTRFPQGTLVTEAQGARVDALLLLDRHQEALAALNALSLRDSGRDQELRVIRGELRARVDCVRALADFDTLLRSSSGAESALVERAFRGSAVCHLRTGQLTRTRHDADRYLRQFPQGRFAQEMRLVRAEALARSGAQRGTGASNTL